jgi:hypothetical protein
MRKKMLWADCQRKLFYVGLRDADGTIRDEEMERVMDSLIDLVKSDIRLM